MQNNLSSFFSNNDIGRYSHSILETLNSEEMSDNEKNEIFNELMTDRIKRRFTKNIKNQKHFSKSKLDILRKMTQNQIDIENQNHLILKSCAESDSTTTNNEI